MYRTPRQIHFVFVPLFSDQIQSLYYNWEPTLRSKEVTINTEQKIDPLPKQVKLC